jgi:hypothetical protein
MLRMCGVLSANEPHFPSLDSRIDTRSENYQKPHALSRSTQDRLSANPFYQDCAHDRHVPWDRYLKHGRRLETEKLQV